LQTLSCPGNEGGHFDLDLCPDIDQAVDKEQCRGREILSQRLLPGSRNALARGFILAAAGQIAATTSFLSIFYQCKPLHYQTDIVAIPIEKRIFLLLWQLLYFIKNVAMALPP